MPVFTIFSFPENHVRIKKNMQNMGIYLNFCNIFTFLLHLIPLNAEIEALRYKPPNV